MAMCTIIDEMELDGYLATHPEIFLKLRRDSSESQKDDWTNLKTQKKLASTE